MEVARVLDVLFRAVVKQRSFRDEETRAITQRALSIREGVLGEDHVDLVKGLRRLCWVCMQRRDGECGMPSCERALAIREKELGTESPELIRDLKILGVAHEQFGDPAAALVPYKRWLAIEEKTHGPDHPNVAKSLEYVASSLRGSGDYAEALSVQERSLAILEKALGRGHPDVSDALDSLALIHWMMGDYRAARSLYERALAIVEEEFGPDHREVASAQNQLGLLLTEMGEYEAARTLMESALRVKEKIHGPDHVAVAHCLSSLGDVFFETGDYATAISMEERALGIYEKKMGPGAPNVAYVLQNLGSALLEVGEYDRARAVLERALAIREDAPRASLAAEETRKSLADLYRVTGDLSRARSLYESVLAVTEEVKGPDHPQVAWTLEGLARVLLLMGQDEEARKIQERALRILEKAFGPEHPDLVDSLHNLASVLAWIGKTPEALETALRAEKIRREHVRLTTRTLPERQALRYAAVHPSGLNVALSVAAAAGPETRRRVWDAVIRSRATMLDQMAARHHTVAEANRIANLAGRLASASQRLANLTVRGMGDQSPEGYRKLLEDARKQKESAERALAQMSVSFQGEQTRDRLGFDDVASALPPDSALVAYVQYDRHPVGGAKGGSEAPAEGPDRAFLAFVLRPGQTHPALVPIGLAKDVEARILRWKEESARGWIQTPGSPDDGEGAYRRAGEALRQVVWDPVAVAVKEAERVFVVPDGPLHLVSLAALPVGEAGYLLESDPVIHYLSAERDLVRSEGGAMRGEGLLALGDPSFRETALFAALDPKEEGTEEEGGLVARMAALLPFRGGRSACGDFQSLRFERLPATGQETEEIAGLWNREEAARRAGGKVRRVTGAGASEAAFKEEAPGKRVLHLATHGFFLGGRCESALASTRGISGTNAGPARGAPPVTGDNPLLLSGLALAGANHRDAAGPDEEDGILTAEEIASLDLSGVEWAVLSACETGVGEIRAGEGVFGLRRAFEVAGVDTLIMSLWSVEDEATREWMRNLYEARFVEGRDTAESVREASLRVLKRRREAGESTHPFYWAAFVAAGEWR